MNWTKLAEGVINANLSVMGEDVTYTPAGGSPVTIKGIFGNRYLVTDADSNMDFITTQPNLGIKLSQLASEPRQGDSITIRGLGYTVQSVHSDGEGAATLLLHRV